MSKVFASLAVLSLALLAGSTPALAQSTEAAQSGYVSPTGVPLAELTAALKANNLELQAARQRLLQAEGRLLQNGLWPNPSVVVENIGGGISSQNAPRETEFALVQPLELGGKRSARIRLAEAEREMIRFEIADLERRLTAELSLRVGEALAAAARLRALDEASELQQQLQRATVLRVSAGDASRFEMILSNAESARLAAERQPSVAALERELAEIKIITGLPQSTPLLLRGADLGMVDPEPPLQEAALVERALAERPDLQAARWRVTMAQSGLLLAEKSAFPDIGLLVGFKQERAATAAPGIRPRSDWLFRFGVTVPLPVFNRNQGSRQEKGAYLDEARLAAELAEQAVRRDVRVAVRRLELAQNTFRLVSARLLPQTESAAQIARIGYELGELPLQQLILEQRRLVEARNSLIQASLEAYRAHAELARALGREFSP